MKKEENKKQKYNTKQLLDKMRKVRKNVVGLKAKLEVLENLTTECKTVLSKVWSKEEGETMVCFNKILTDAREKKAKIAEGLHSSKATLKELNQKYSFHEA